MVRHTVDARLRSTEAVCAGMDPALVSASALLAVRVDDESRDGEDEACTLDERRGAKPPRRGAELPEKARSASRGAQRSVAFFRVQRRFSRSEGGEGLLGLV